MSLHATAMTEAAARLAAREAITAAQSADARTAQDATAANWPMPSRRTKLCRVGWPR